MCVFIWMLLKNKFSNIILSTKKALEGKLSREVISTALAAGGQNCGWKVRRFGIHIVIDLGFNLDLNVVVLELCQRKWNRFLSSVHSLLFSSRLAHFPYSWPIMYLWPIFLIPGKQFHPIVFPQLSLIPMLICKLVHVCSQHAHPYTVTPCFLFPMSAKPWFPPKKMSQTTCV